MTALAALRIGAHGPRATYDRIALRGMQLVRCQVLQPRPVTWGMEEDAACRLPVTPCTTAHLIVRLNARRWTVIDHAAHVALVDAEAEGLLQDTHACETSGWRVRDPALDPAV